MYGAALSAHPSGGLRDQLTFGDRKYRLQPTVQAYISRLRQPSRETLQITAGELLGKETFMSVHVPTTLQGVGLFQDF